MSTLTKEKPMKQAELMETPPHEANHVNGANVPAVSAAANPLAIIEAAVAQGIDADKLEKLLALQERWEANQARNAYNAAMSAAQAEMPSVVRDKENTHLKTKYARLESIAAAIQPVYARHGFSLSFGTLADAPPDCCRIFCDCRHEAGHVERIEGNFPLDLRGTGGTVNKTGIQAMGSTISYARRYLTMMIFNIAVKDEDDDGNSTSAAISPEQIGLINDQLGRIMPADVDGVIDRMLKFSGVSSIDQIPAARFEAAYKKLKAKADTYNQ